MNDALRVSFSCLTVENSLLFQNVTDWGFGVDGHSNSRNKTELTFTDTVIHCSEIVEPTINKITRKYLVYINM